MINFYQSDVWRYINASIFQKPIFEINMFWESYFWTVKSKKKFWFNFQWFQIMWIKAWFPNQTSFELLKETIYEISRDYTKDYWNIMFQFWFIDLLSQFPVSNLKNDEFVSSIRKTREENESFFINSMHLQPSFRENMPLSTIIFDLSQWYDSLFDSMSKSARAHVNKWNFRNLVFSLADREQERDEFYQVWFDTSREKWFNIFPQSTFKLLRDYLISTNNWNLFLAKLDWKIVSWSICFFVWESIIYMYWATNRWFWNVWWHHFLKSEIFKRGINNWFRYVDLLWTSPTWYPDHHLCWVSKFKESLWGNKLEYYWNFDYILNNHLYKLFKHLKS